MEESPAELLMSRKLRTKLPTPKHLLEPKPKPKPVTYVRHQLLSHQQHQKTFHDRGTRPLPALCQGEPVRIRQERMWMPAVIVKQHQAPRSFIVATPDGSQLRRNRIDLLPTKETPVMSTASEPASEETSPPMPLNSDVGVARNTTELQRSQSEQPSIPEVDPPIRRSERMGKATQRLIETI